jgi:hypothetical protein
MQVHIVIARYKENLKWLFQLMADKSWMTASVYNDGDDDINTPDIMINRIQVLPGDHIPCEPSKYTSWIINNWEMMNIYSHIVFLQADPIYHNPTLIECFNHIDKWNKDYQNLTLYPHPPPWNWAPQIADGTAPNITYFEPGAKVWNDFMDDTFRGKLYYDPFLEGFIKPSKEITVSYLCNLFGISNPINQGQELTKCFAALFAASPLSIKRIGIDAWKHIDEFQRIGCVLSKHRSQKERAIYLEYMWSVILYCY